MAIKIMLMRYKSSKPWSYLTLANEEQKNSLENKIWRLL